MDEAGVILAADAMQKAQSLQESGKTLFWVCRK